METTKRTQLTIEGTIDAPVAKVWQYWNEPQHIMNWAFASPDWHAPAATNDLRPGGTFSTTMAAKDGSFSFDFGGVYDEVTENKLIAYTMGDGRTVRNTFKEEGGKTHIVSVFEAEDTNPIEMQQAGWQAILDNFKQYTEAN